MPARQRDNSGASTPAERRLDEQLGLVNRRQEQDAERLDVHSDQPDPRREIRGAYLSRRLVESPDEGGWRLFWRRTAQPPVVRITDSIITGHLDLRAADLPYLLQFVRCRFQHAPDLRQATMAGIILSNCRFPGLRARNLATANDMALLHCASTGEVKLTDAQIGGTLSFNNSELRHPRQRALNADRLTVAGALLGMGILVAGELRIPGARVGGNVTLSGAAIRNRGRAALNATGIHVRGSLRCDMDPSGRPFSAAGRLYLPSARIEGDLRLRSAILEPGISPAQLADSPYDDPVCNLIADRSEIHGDVQLDQQFTSGGTLRLVSTRIDGDLRMANAYVDLSWSPALSVERPLRSLHLDGTEILGNLDARNVVLHGQVRMVDVRVRGGFQLSNATLIGPDTDVLQANRIQVGSELDCREADISGSVQLQAAQIGANVDLRSTSLIKPGWRRHDNSYKSVLDLRAASIGRDLICAEGIRRFVAQGEVQLRRATVGRQAAFIGCVLGDDESLNAINAFGLVAQELSLRPAEPPRGRVQLRQAHCELLADNPTLWQATKGVDVDNFSYDNFRVPIAATDQVQVRQRLRWLHSTAQGQYQPGPYDQLATVFRNNGNEDHADTVMVEKQRRRYQAIASGSHPAFRLSVRLWSWLQWITVSYGYRPMRALVWLILFAGLGTLWFLGHPLHPVNREDFPFWNPFLYTVDQLLPIIDFGNKNRWAADGASQWISAFLVIVGWTLATTVAAGVTRALRRER